MVNKINQIFEIPEKKYVRVYQEQITEIKTIKSLL